MDITVVTSLTELVIMSKGKKCVFKIDLSDTHRKLRSAGGAEGAFQTNRVGQSGAREEHGLRSGQA